MNLIGDHTDYNGGLALAMAIDLSVTVTFTPSDADSIVVSSDAYATDASGVPAVLPLPQLPDPASVASITPPWARMVAAVVALAEPDRGGTLAISSTVPVGSGLSSSAALCIATFDALGPGPPVRSISTGSTGTAGSSGSAAELEAIIDRCRQVEHLLGVPVGIMDPWVCAGAEAGHALRIDFANSSSTPVAIPEDAAVVVVDSGQSRVLQGTAYSERVAECRAAEAVIGSLGAAELSALSRIDDPLLRRRARHVITECRRVRQVATAFESADLVEAGRLLSASHRSLAEEFAVSTPTLDALVARLGSLPGVLGARMTGAGFGGAVVALTRPGAVDPTSLGLPTWTVRPSDGALARRGGSGHS